MFGKESSDASKLAITTITKHGRRRVPMNYVK
jgi:hypothetical protein